jgi:hypothetical protein
LKKNVNYYYINKFLKKYYYYWNIFLDLKGKIKNYKNFVKKSKGKKKEIKSRITELKNIIYTN